VTAGRPVRVLVVDDHTLFRRGVTALLAQDARIEVVGDAGDAGEAQRRCEALQPDVVLLDNHLPGVRGVDAIGGLREAAPSAQVLMLTVSEDEGDLAAALRGGARGYLLKTVDHEVLVTAILRTARGESVVSPEMTGKLVVAFQAQSPGAAPPAPAAAAAASEPDPAPDPIDSLSPRETEILDEIARGASNKEIARTLGIAETTVKIHVQHILRKLGLHSRVQAAVAAAGRRG
jgi:two-component system nitrate/nitrite response regulator NarL